MRIADEKMGNTIHTLQLSCVLLQTTTILPGVASGLIILDNLRPVGFSSHRRYQYQQKIRVRDMHGQTSLMEGSSSIHSSDDSNNCDTAPSIPSHQAEMDVIKLAQSHFSSQALVAIIQIGVFDYVLDVDASFTVDEIIAKIKDYGETTFDDSSLLIRRDALFRCIRLVCTTGALKETQLTTTKNQRFQ